MNESRILIGTAREAHVRFYIGDTTMVGETARLLHDLWPTSLAALSRVMSITACMGLMQKNEKESITTTVNGGGSLGTIMVTAKNDGKIKGFVGDPHSYLKYNANNKLAVGSAVGTNGYIKVLKNLRLKQSYTSEVTLRTGEIGDDFAYYFQISEQVPTVISVGEIVNDDYSLKASGILFLELLPNHNEEDIVYLENLIKDLKPIAKVIEDNIDLVTYINSLFSDAKILEEEVIKYECDCSRERFMANLLTLPKKDIEDLAKDENIEIKCEFCNKVYKYSKADLEKVLTYANYRENKNK